MLFSTPLPTLKSNYHQELKCPTSRCVRTQSAWERIAGRKRTPGRGEAQSPPRRRATDDGEEELLFPSPSGPVSMFFCSSLSLTFPSLSQLSLSSQPQDPPPSEAVSGSSALEALPAVSRKKLKDDDFLSFLFLAPVGAFFSLVDLAFSSCLTFLSSFSLSPLVPKFPNN